MQYIFNKGPFPERRSTPRILCDYPAVVQGQDLLGRIFDEKARVLNLGKGGAFMITRISIRDATVVHLKIVLPTGSLIWGSTGLDTNGKVMRSEPQANGEIGMGIRFEGYKFI